ncbi:RimJ/RimL family protein N-acetyltransferase [Deinococcus metalli]|nr:GNAT family N-acetyltransferase [Deinococcus metalli]MBB5377050.1 RimJ/RimL family protein N-acetyltransferase [Deinococcus metalli]
MAEPTSPPATLLPLPDDVQLRPVTPDDFPALAAFLTAAHPDHPLAAADLERHATFRLPDEPHWHVLAQRGGTLVGMAEAGVPRMDGHPGWIQVTATVNPPDTALMGALLDQAEARALAFGARTLTTGAREGWWEVPLLEARGYAVHDRMWPSVLDLTTLDDGRFRAFEERAAASGATLRTLPDLGDIHTDGAMQRRLYDLVAALLRDVPSATPVSVWPFETWQRRFLSGLKHPEGVFVAVAPDGGWVGVSELHMPMPARPGTLMIGLTGVLPAWRRRGLAYALKLAAARAGHARGYTKVFTGNHSRNAPMLAINEAMGFVREPARLTLTREVEGATG